MVRRFQLALSLALNLSPYAGSPSFGPGCQVHHIPRIRGRCHRSPRALRRQGVTSGLFSDTRFVSAPLERRGLIVRFAGFEETPNDRPLDREVDVLQQHPEFPGQLEAAQPGNDDAGEMPRCVDDRPAAIAWLYRRRDLDQSRVDAGIGGGAHIASRDIQFGRQEPR